MRKEDGMPIIAKVLLTENSTTADKAMLLHEYEMIKNLPIPGVIKALSLESSPEFTALILEDNGSISLSSYLKQHHCDLALFFAVATQVCETLAELHRCGIIHKDLKPDNLIINPLTKRVTLIDFSHSTRYRQKGTNMHSLGGSMPYMSPEQTGRMNRPIDFRSDLYSLGIVFYEMLTGQFPLHGETKMEWAHAHIAKKPIPVHHRVPGLPRMISELVMKLLAKTAEDRYQSAQGLLADLQHCWQEWERIGEIQPFALGEKDEIRTLQLPSKLYGRKAEIEALQAAFTRVRAGATECTLVSGYSGVGKTELILESYRSLVTERGYFISGKFDQFQQDIPFASLIQAFQELMRQILTEDTEKIADWKRKLLRALGRNGAVVTDVIPEVKLIIGEQPPVEELAVAEAQNRFQMVFRKFVLVFASKSHPLILFFDDLHWADPASLDFLRLLLADPGSRYLLLIGAYRENEVSETHQLHTTMAAMEAKGIGITRVRLYPLEKAETFALVSETLRSEDARVQPLVDVLYRKTAGNPFYLRQLLQAMHADQMLWFDAGSGRWEWDMPRIEQKQSFDDVISLMIEKIKRLPEETVQAIRTAGCIGNSFDGRTLGAILGTKEKETADRLGPALQEGLLLTDDSGMQYSFLHDRVQQAAYSLIPEADKKEMHLQIGRLMLDGNVWGDADEKIYQIVYHLNIGREMMNSREEKRRLSRLNMHAGEKAKASTAYASALSHFRTALELLTDEDWSYEYEATFRLHLQAAECEYLCGHYEQAEQQFVHLMQRAKTNLDRAEVYRIRIALYINLGKYVEAIELGLEGLKDFQMPIAVKPSSITLARELFTTRWKLRNRMEDLADLPDVTDPTVKSLMELITVIAAPAFFVNKDVFLILISKYVRLALRYGNTEASATAYAFFGLILSLGLGLYKEGFRMGEIAQKVLDRLPNTIYKCRTNVIFGGILYQWARPSKGSDAYLNEALQLGLECGDFIYASYAIGSHINSYYAREPLPEFAALIKRYLGILEQINEEFVTMNCHLYLQVIHNLQGKTNHRLTLSDEEFSEDRFLQEITHEETQVTTFFQYYTYKTQISYLFGEHQDALKFAGLANGYQKYSTHMLHTAEVKLYETLAIASAFASFSPEEQTKYKKIMNNNIRQIKKWADCCPENFLHKYLLVAAEKARLHGEKQRAMDLYDQAIQSAKENHYYQNAAIACECAASFHTAEGRALFAKTYLIEAIHGFQRWGAAEKCNQLLEKYPELQSVTLPFDQAAASLMHTDAHSYFHSHTSTKSSTQAEMDVNMFLQAMQHFTREKELPQLLLTYLETAMKIAGADKGFVLLEKDSELCIEASKAADEGYDTPMPETGDLNDTQKLPATIVHYVARTRETVVLSDASKAGIFVRDTYFKEHQPCSILCLPILYDGMLVGALYLENNLMTDVFHSDQLELLEMLSTQMASTKLLRFSDRAVTLAKGNHSAVDLPVPQLTGRELDILMLIAKGMSNQEIAEHLVLTVGTVKSYIVNIYGKLEVNRRVQAVARAKELKILE
ncbi:MAG: helix-turn-helix transcriptional regulator [Clostridia bacterium]